MAWPKKWDDASSMTGLAALRDATGYALVGREPNGKYVYQLADGRTFRWTHEHRVKIAAWRAVLEQVQPGAARALGLCRWNSLALDEASGRSIARELVKTYDTVQRQRLALALGNPAEGRFDAAAQRERATFWYVKLALATKDWTVWPKVKLRHSLTQAQRVARDRAHYKKKLADRSPLEKLRDELTKAQAKADEWTSRAGAAERRANKWAAKAQRLTKKIQKLEKNS